MTSSRCAIDTADRAALRYSYLCAKERSRLSPDYPVRAPLGATSIERSEALPLEDRSEGRAEPRHGRSGWALGFIPGRRGPPSNSDTAAAKRIRSPTKLNLALQGGGAHGAFTWGVLDRLAESEAVELSAISGTSAGAVNAAVFASGWLAGGPAVAKARLAELWQAVADVAAHLSPAGLSQIGLDAATHLLSPYQLNPLRLDPLRDMLLQLVDFSLLREAGAPKLFIAATNMRTGRPRIFQNAELSVDAVLASACLPRLHHAVEIDGDAYWDGGYVSNPPLLPLVEGSSARDTLLVRINVADRAEQPLSAAGIRSRVGEIVFEQPLTQELALLQARRGRQPSLARLSPSAARRRIARHRLHIIDGGAAIAELDPSTRVIAGARVLDHLRALGRQAADHWLAEGREARPRGHPKR